MRVALYARVSTQRQAQAQTVEQQPERLKGQAQQHGWDVPADQVFRDDGFSGASLRRPGLDRLRDRAAARMLDLVVITAPDRLARNYVHQVLLLEELQGHGCEVRFPDRPMSQDPHDQLLLQIRGAVAEYERTLITERMRRGRQRKLEAGLMLPWTRAPFGYRVDPDHPRDPAGVRIEEAEAAIVREMFAWYAQEAHSGLACLARATIHRQRDYSCTGKLPALFSHREQKCPSRLSPAERLDELVWADLCALLTHPKQVAEALMQAHGGHWLPQDLQARQQGLRRGQASLGQQLERLTDAYLAGVVALDEYQRRRSELERRQQQLEKQARQLEAQADRQHELAGLSCSIKQFCRRVDQGLSQASFEQKRSLVELLIDRVIVSDGEVEIRYVVPTSRASEQVRFCHLRLDYRTRSPGHQRPMPAHARLQVPEVSCPTLPGLRRAAQLSPTPLPPQPACPSRPPQIAPSPLHHDRVGHLGSRTTGRRCLAKRLAALAGARSDGTGPRAGDGVTRGAGELTGIT